MCYKTPQRPNIQYPSIWNQAALTLCTSHRTECFMGHVSIFMLSVDRSVIFHVIICSFCCCYDRREQPLFFSTTITRWTEITDTNHNMIHLWSSICKCDLKTSPWRCWHDLHSNRDCLVHLPTCSSSWVLTTQWARSHWSATCSPPWPAGVLDRSCGYHWQRWTGPPRRSQTSSQHLWDSPPTQWCLRERRSEWWKSASNMATGLETVVNFENYCISHCCQFPLYHANFLQHWSTCRLTMQCLNG